MCSLCLCPVNYIFYFCEVQGALQHPTREQCRKKPTSSWKSRCCELCSSQPWQHLFAWRCCKKQRLLNSHLELTSIARDAGDFKDKARTEIAHTCFDLWQGCDRSALRKCKKAPFSRALRSHWSSECSSLLDTRGTSLGSHGPALAQGTWKVSSAVLSHRHSSTKPLFAAFNALLPNPACHPTQPRLKSLSYCCSFKERVGRQMFHLNVSGGPVPFVLLLSSWGSDRMFPCAAVLVSRQL